MEKHRSKTRHRRAKRMVPGVVAAFVAATAMAYGSGPSHGQHEAETQGPPQVAGGGSGPGSPAAQGDGVALGELAVIDQAEGAEAAAPPSHNGTFSTPHGPDAEAPGAEGFVPTADEGLRALASYQPIQGDAADPAAPGETPSAGETSGADTATFQTAANDSDGGDYGFGGGGGAGGGGGGSGGGGGGGGGSGGGGSASGGGLTDGSLINVNNPGPVGGVNPFTGLTPPVIGGDEKSCPPNCGVTVSVVTPPGLGRSGPTTNSIIPPTEGGGGRNVAIIPPTAVPEPASWLMLIVGFFGLGAALRRRRHRDLSALA